MFSRFTQFALVALALVFGSPAGAAPLTYGTYYDETVSTSCIATSCRLFFSQTPADKLLMVNKINCNIVSQLQPTDLILQISSTLGGNPLTRHLRMSFSAPQFVAGFYVVNMREDTHYLVGQGRFPSVLLGSNNTSSNFSMDCTIIGDLVTPIS